MRPDIATKRKSIDSLAFEHYLRTGEQLTPSEWLARYERKFNPYHDPANGQFTFAPDGAGLTPNKPAKATSGKTKPSGLKPVDGYPEDGKKAWRQANDAAFTKAANDFNQRNGLKPGDPRYVDPQFLKAWAMIESGGEGDKQAFLADPFQVNNAGDSADKNLIGLAPGQAMTPASSADAALRWLDMKSHTQSLGADGKYHTTYIGLKRGLARYNGNHRKDSNGKPHNENYANKILSLIGL